MQVPLLNPKQKHCQPQMFAVGKTSKINVWKKQTFRKPEHAKTLCSWLAIWPDINVAFSSISSVQCMVTN